MSFFFGTTSAGFLHHHDSFSLALGGLQIPWDGGSVLHQPPSSFGFYSQTRGTREIRCTLCQKHRVPQRVPAGQTRPHQPRIFVSHCTCPHSPPLPIANSIVLGPAAINNNWSFTKDGDATRAELRERLVCPCGCPERPTPLRPRCARRDGPRPSRGACQGAMPLSKSYNLLECHHKLSVSRRHYLRRRTGRVVNNV